jgi:16S rRNA (cytosine967-C5)-methyltransferase
MTPRLSRAGLTNVSTWVLQSEHDERLKRLRGKADVVLVDAPCSGLGTLRRSPELKWRVTPETLHGMAALQSRILDAAAELVKPGGRLVYATCSFMREEDEDVALAFDARHSNFEPVAAQPVLDALVGRADHGLCDASGRWMRAWPHRHHTDGFFASIWRAR